MSSSGSPDRFFAVLRGSVRGEVSDAEVDGGGGGDTALSARYLRLLCGDIKGFRDSFLDGGDAVSPDLSFFFFLRFTSSSSDVADVTLVGSLALLGY